MDKKIAIIGIIAAVVIVAAAAVLVMNGGDDGNDEEKYTDASQIGASFSKNYSGTFGENFYLDDGATASKAKVYYPNGSTSSYGSNENYLTFKVFSDAAQAKEEFDTNKADYTAQIGKSVMGSTVQGVYEKASMDDAIGYYNNFNMGTASSYIYYTGYSGNFFFEGYIYLKGVNLTDNDVKGLAEGISAALKNPVSTDQAKKYTEPVTPVTPDTEYKGAALICSNYTESAKKYGSSATDYAVTSDSTAMSAKLATSDSKYYLDVQISTDAKSLYDTEATTISGTVGTTVMSATVMAVSEKTGFTDGSGYYYNATMRGTAINIIDYAGYIGNYYAHVHLRSATAITDESAAEMVKDLATYLHA